MTKLAKESFDKLLRRVRACTLCEDKLQFGARPVLQAAPSATILIAGQAPGARVHKTGIPFNDPSGDKLRSWMGVDKDTFHDATRIAILPMGFCYPGKGKSGDLPPDPRCAAKWRQELLAQLANVQLTLVIGQYAQKWFWPDHKNVTETVARWQELGPATVPLPHPSPRNVAWFKRNPWFDEKLLPVLQEQIAELIQGDPD